MRAEMKILGTLFRLLCALVVLLALAMYLGGPLQVSLPDYLASFTPERLLALADLESWPAIAAGALLLLTLCCGIRLGWNIVYGLATLAFFAEVAVLGLGADVAVPTAARGFGWEAFLTELPLHFPVPALMIPALCMLGVFCSSAPVRIALTSLLCCALCYGVAELAWLGLLQWQGMAEPFLPGVLTTLQTYTWLLVLFPIVFFAQYAVYMAMFEAFIPSKKKNKRKDDKKEDATKQQEEGKTDEKKPVARPAATVPVVAKPVVMKKRPVIHKKSPVATEPEEVKESQTEAARAEVEPAKPEEPARLGTPVEPEMPAKPEAPAAPESPAGETKADTAAPAEEAPREEEVPKTELAEDKKPDVPADLPPVPPAAA